MPDWELEYTCQIGNWRVHARLGIGGCMPDWELEDARLGYDGCTET